MSLLKTKQIKPLGSLETVLVNVGTSELGRMVQALDTGH
jgi:hypothetical protein